MRRTLTSILGLTLALAAGSCYQDDSTGLTGGKPSTVVELTDDPFPYDSVERVDLYVVKIEASTSLDTSNLDPASWVTVAEPHRTFNLIELSGGITDTLGGANIPPGQYRSIRMVLDTDSSSITAKNGQPMTVDWQSSAGRPVLYAYVENPINVTDFGAEIVLDFDAGRSFLCDAPCASFVFSPVFRAVNKSTTGTISGRVTGDTLVGATSIPIKDVTVTIYRGDIAAFSGSWFVVATGKTDSLGSFRIAFLLPGTYILRADAPRHSPFSPGVRGNVVVSAGQETQNQGIALPFGAPGSLVVTPYPAGLQVGDSIVLTASVLGQNGAAVPNPVVGWSVQDTAIAAVFPLPGQQALLKAKAPGTTQLLVSSQGVATSFTINVSAGPPPALVPVASVTIVPPSGSMARGDTLGLIAQARDSTGALITGRTFTYSWSTSDTLVAKVTFVGPNGGNYAIIRAGVPGTVQVRTSTEGKTGTSTITVR
jgi:hypothetical protein